MKNLLVIVFSVVCLNAFAQERKFKNLYSQFPAEIPINISKDSVWNNVINFLTEKGYGVHSQNRTEGNIISNRFNIKWTYEKKGKIRNDTAIIIVPLYYNKRNNTVYPFPHYNGILSGEISIIIKENKIVVNVANVEQAVYDVKDGNTKYVPYSNFKSTGVLEKELNQILN